MKLGTQTGSLVNHVYSKRGYVEPKVGDGATILEWTDREACTVTRVFTIGAYPAVEVQVDHAMSLVPDYREDQDYAYVPDPAGRTYIFRWRGDTWECVRWNTETKRWRISSACGLYLGARRKYRDPCF